MTGELKSTGRSSLSLGECEVCGGHVSEVYMQHTPDGLDYVFGHRDCLNSLAPEIPIVSGEQLALI